MAKRHNPRHRFTANDFSRQHTAAEFRSEMRKAVLKHSLPGATVEFTSRMRRTTSPTGCPTILVEMRVTQSAKAEDIIGILNYTVGGGYAIEAAPKGHRSVWG